MSAQEAGCQRGGFGGERVCVRVRVLKLRVYV